MSKIIVKPILTEKSSLIGEEGDRFVFEVDRQANKIQVKDAVEKAYGVQVEKVNTLNVAGKKKGRYTKKGYTSGRTNHYKKAIVKLVEGETIDLYDNI